MTAAEKKPILSRPRNGLSPICIKVNRFTIVGGCIVSEWTPNVFTR
jgi:hypothetical protein